MSTTVDTTTARETDPQEFVATAARIGAEVLAVHAADVDAESRFPQESIDAMREAGMIGALVPTEMGGLGLSVETVARSVTELARHCASSAMVYAMHQIQVACLVKHGTTPELEDFTERVAREKLLLASATTEVGIGGDVRSSTCAVELDGDDFTLRKQAPVISYGQHA